MRIETRYAPQTGSVTLDFTNAAAALDHLRTAVQKKSPIVIGSTGFTAQQQAEVDRLAPQTRIVIAPNMSVGIAVLQQLTRAAAIALGPDFDVEIVEMHHRMKVDAPSGTALALGEVVAEAHGAGASAADARLRPEGRGRPTPATTRSASWHCAVATLSVITP